MKVLGQILDRLKNKKLVIAMVLAMSMSLLCACGDEIPEMTDEEMSIISDYASALLLKYDSGAPSRLLPEGAVDLSIVYHEPLTTGNVESGDSEMSISGDIDTAQKSEDTLVNDTTIPESNSNDRSNGFADFLDGTGLQIEFAGNIEVVDSYPTENTNAYFTTDASAGNKLLVSHYTLSNVSGDSLNVNMNSLGLRYRVSVDGGKNKNVMTTMLDNDILSFVGTLNAGESVDLVAIAEIPEDNSEFSSLVLTIRGEEFSSKLVLVD